MLWLRVAAIWTVVTAADAVNRPVYKVVLTQKGYAQFLQYDLETPPLLEFTFCTWIRLYDLKKEQTIFTYIVKSNRNMVRLWIDSGGRNIQLAINGWLATTSPIEMVQDVWKHVCVSYQSDYGAWALYVDSRLLTCGASQALNGFILPPGGSINIGYGATDSGSPSGIEGEIFGANMILTSTIERNYTMKQNPRFKQKHFQKNKLKGNRGDTDKYIVLNNIKSNNVHNTFENKNSPFSRTTFGNHQFMSMETSKESDILDFTNPVGLKMTTSDPMSVQFWNLVEDTLHDSRLEKNREPFSSETKGLPSVSEFETPPPPGPANLDYFDEKQKEKGPKSSNNNNNKNAIQLESPKSQKENDISEVETPPPPQSDKNVYGQWVSSKFAGSVLNHLRSIQFPKKDIIKPLPTIPLHKTSDAFPYASEFKLTKLRPPARFERRNLLENHFYPEVFGKRRPQTFNVQILEDDIRERILKSHARLKPMNIDVINKGESTITHERYYRQAIDSQSKSSETSESIEIQNTPQPFIKSINTKSTNTKKKSHLIQKSQLIKQKDGNGSENEKNKIKNFLTILPFLKTLEYLIEDSDNTESKNVYKSDIYTRSLSDGNKWHNTKSYSNDYTPRQVTMTSNTAAYDMESKLANTNTKHPNIKLKYKHKGKGDVEHPDKNGQIFLKSVSPHAITGLDQSQNIDSVSIHKFIVNPEKSKSEEKDNSNVKSNLEGAFNKNNFNKHVKIGNALNERFVIGKDDVQKKRSFEGGDARVPDINRYRSDIDKAHGNVPPSLNIKVCKNVELFDRVLYIQPDESVDLTYFLSPVKLKNPSIEFIQQNYRHCSLDGSIFEKDPLLYLDWSKTPVRLFGGAYLQPTTDLCGFF